MAAIEPAPNGLTPQEARHLGALEKRIARGLQTFREVGAALLEIRDDRLYRGTHTSFEAYCVERWGMERQRAYQFIGAAEVVEVLGEQGDLIQNEAQARELVGLAHSDPGRLSEVLDAVEGPLTGPSLRKAVAKVVGKPSVADDVPDTPSTQAVVGAIDRARSLLSEWVDAGPDEADRDRVGEALQRLAEAGSGVAVT